MSNYVVPNGVILAIDSSGLTCSAAVIKDGKVLSSVFLNNGLTHSRTLLPSAKKALEDALLSVNDVDAVAVTVGPGSFTGVKIGVATAKGIAFTKDVPCLAVSSEAALACGARGFDGMICPVSDARRGMLYNAMFLSGQTGVARLCEDRQIAADELAKEIEKSGKKTLVLGDGTDILAAECRKNDVSFFTAAQNVSFIHPEGILEAISNGLYEEKTHESLCAVYLRPPQAERERLERLEAEKNQKIQGETK
jgi:tRNA threonylcarbamoyladenosine biosynthesis protein TsaB